MLKLGSQKEFRQEYARLTGLVEGAGFIKSPSLALVRFVESTMDQGPTNAALGALAQMHTPEACAILEKHLRGSDLLPGTKNGLLIWDLLPVRDQPEVIRLYSRLLKDGVKDYRFRNDLVGSLFDYQKLWYGSADKYPVLPSWDETPTPSLKELLQLADVCLKLDVPAETRAAVAKSRKQIEDILAKREKKN